MLATLRGTGGRVCANDIASGHYGSAIQSLEVVTEAVKEILPESAPDIRCETCAIPYPESLEHLQGVLATWQGVGASFGFLDPMRYVLGERGGPYTHDLPPPTGRASLRVRI